MPYILALDQGTTSSRAIVFDHDGAIRAVAQKEFTQIFPSPGWVEHDPREIWASQIGVAVEALGRAQVAPKEVAAIGITNQRETTIVWDRETGEPIHNAIVWQDRRTADYCQRLKAEGAGETIQAKTGLLIDAYFSASKIRWLLDNVPGARARAEAGKLAFGTVDTWLVWKLTNHACHATVVTSCWRDRIGFVPMFCSRKQPVPYVFFDMPGVRHICPNSAACWSPAMPAIGTLSMPSDVDTSP